MTYRRVEVLAVEAWGRRVGAVAPSSNRRGFAFQYDPAWAGTGVELSPFLMPTSRSRSVFTFPELPVDTYYGLPPLLADSLPDHFGNAIVDAVLAREGVAAADVTALDRLAYAGTRAMGALTFVPDRSPDAPPTALEMSELVDAARRAVHGDLAAPDARGEAVRHLLAVGTSAGGARAKAVIAWNRATGELRAGGVDAPAGFEQWLLKFDGVGRDHQLGDSQLYGRIEYAYSLMARAAGVEMAPTALLEEGGRAHFVTRRFDRPGTDGERLHLQTLCGLAAMDFNATGTHDYASYLAAIRSLGIDGAAEGFRRIVLNVLASNNDDHTKNLSFLMDRSGAWALAPAYDVTFAYHPASRWTARHLMAVEGKFEDITLADLELLADKAEVPGYRAIIDQVADAVARFPDFAEAAGLSRGDVEPIVDRLGEVWRAARNRD